MKIQAKEILLLILGIAFTLILSLLFGDKLNNPQKLSFLDIIILIGLVIIFIVFFLYKKIREVDVDVNSVRKNYNKLNEKLKIHEQLINLEARIIALEKGKNGKN